MEYSKKLYKVTLRGMQYTTTNPTYGTSYVIAEDSHQAYTKVRNYLEDNDIGFSRERALEKIELIASCPPGTDTEYLLYL